MLNWSIEEKRPQIPFDTIFSKLSLISHIFWFCISGLGIDPIGIGLESINKSNKFTSDKNSGAMVQFTETISQARRSNKKTLESNNLREREREGL